MTPPLAYLSDAVASRAHAVESPDVRAAVRLSALVREVDNATHAHSVRMASCSSWLAEAVGLPWERCELLRVAAPLHDIGKLAIPGEVLQRPGALSPAERNLVQTHAAIGYRMLAGSDSSLLDLAATIALTHHEQVDGRGYPRGLAGSEIPIEGRIAAVADVFDALLSDRPYRPAYSLEDALQLIGTLAGTQLDEELVVILDDLVRVSVARAV